MAGYKKSFIDIIRRISSFAPTKKLIRILPDNLLLPFYHTVSDHEIIHIKHLYKVKGKNQFIKDLDHLLKLFIPIGLDDLKKKIDQNTPFRKPSFLLSFDDGLKEFYEIIAPVLIEKGVPAVCFLNSAFIDNKDLFYRYKASILIEQFRQNPKLVGLSNLSTINGLNNYDAMRSFLLSTSYKERAILDEIALSIGYSFQEFLDQNQPYLTSYQIISLQEKGFDFGAHSVDHPEYRLLTHQEQILQTQNSMQQIKKNFSVRYNCFSFPFTDYQVSEKFFNEVYSKKIVDISFGCAGIKKDNYPNHFQRIALESGTLSAKEIINAELIYYLLKTPFGKNVIKRS